MTVICTQPRHTGDVTYRWIIVSEILCLGPGWPSVGMEPNLASPPRQRVQLSKTKFDCRISVHIVCAVTVKSEMGIDLATWRARIGLNYYHQCRYACRSLPVLWRRATRWGVGEVVSSTPLVLQGCIAVVSLSLILEYAFHKWGGLSEGEWRVWQNTLSQVGEWICPECRS